MGPAEHALWCLVEGELALAWWGEWAARLPTHDETLWLVQEHLRYGHGAGKPVEALLLAAQALHGKGSYVVPDETPWAPPWRVGPGGRLRGVDGRIRDA